jgi:hypothetical protein
MKKTLLLTICAVAVSVLHVSAQNSKDNNKDNDRNSSGLALSIGASAIYYYGPGSRNFDKFEDDRLNWQLNGMLGITLARDGGGRRTMLAAFGNYGFNNRQTITHLFDDQGYIPVVLFEQSANNNFYQYEGGVLIAEVLRLSTGLGQQNFREQLLLSSGGVSLNSTSLKYYSTTVGINLNLGPVAWVINCNFNYGKDYEETVLTPSTGLMLRF